MSLISRVFVSQESHGIFMKARSVDGDIAIEGSIVWHDGRGYMTFGVPDLDDSFICEPVEILAIDSDGAFDSASLREKIAAEIANSDVLCRALGCVYPIVDEAHGFEYDWS